MWSFISLIASTLLSVILAPNNKAQEVPPKSLEDVDITTAEQNRPIPIVFGRVRIRGNVTWYGDLRVEEVKKEGGKK